MTVDYDSAQVKDLLTKLNIKKEELQATLEKYVSGGALNDKELKIVLAYQNKITLDDKGNVTSVVVKGKKYDKKE